MVNQSINQSINQNVTLHLQSNIIVQHYSA